MPYATDVVFAVIRFAGLYLAAREWRDSFGDFERATKAKTNGSRILLAKERLLGSGLSLVVQTMLCFSIAVILTTYPEHDDSTDLSLLIGTLVSATLGAKALVTKAARRKVAREQATP